MNPPREPYLLTPGPLTTSLATKSAMLRDWGSWDSDFNELTAGVCRRLLAVAHAEGTHVCVPLQGSGTFSVEAALATLLPRDGKALVLMNGAYGQRMARILKYLGRDFTTLDMGDYLPPRPSAWKPCWRPTRISPTSRWSTAKPHPASSIRWKPSPRSSAAKIGGCSWTR